MFFVSIALSLGQLIPRFTLLYVSEVLVDEEELVTSPLLHAPVFWLLLALAITSATCWLFWRTRDSACRGSLVTWLRTTARQVLQGEKITKRNWPGNTSLICILLKSSKENVTQSKIKYNLYGIHKIYIYFFVYFHRLHTSTRRQIYEQLARIPIPYLISHKFD